MKNHIISGSIILASCGLASAQNLYNLAPNTEAAESSPLKWTAGLEIGFDDNVTPTVLPGTAGFEDDATSVTAYVGADLVNITPQTTWDVFAKVGGIYYLDSPAAIGSDDFFGQARLSANWTHRVSERLRFSSRNYVAYELEPDYSYGLTVDRLTEEYLHYQTDNSVGYRWTERFGTYTGFRVRGIDYNSVGSNNDRISYSIYNQFRFRATEQTNWTFDYRYGWTETSGSAADSENHYFLLGLEHRFSPNTILAAKAGVQVRDTDGGADGDKPFFEAALRSRLNEQLSVRTFVRYSIEEYGTSLGGGYTYDSNQTLRFGVSADYIVSPTLTLHGGINYINIDMEDGRGPTTLSDLDQDLLNLYLGFSYKVNDGVFITGSYNWTDSDGNGGVGPVVPFSTTRTYDRNRASLGVRVEF